MLAFAVSMSALSSSPSFAFSAEAQQMCTGDAFRLCSSEIPNIPKITACMVQHRAQLSSGCRAVLDRDLAAADPARSPPSNAGRVGSPGPTSHKLCELDLRPVLFEHGSTREPVSTYRNML